MCSSKRRVVQDLLDLGFGKRPRTLSRTVVVALRPSGAAGGTDHGARYTSPRPRPSSLGRRGDEGAPRYDPHPHQDRPSHRQPATPRGGDPEGRRLARGRRGRGLAPPEQHRGIHRRARARRTTPRSPPPRRRRRGRRRRLAARRRSQPRALSPFVVARPRETRPCLPRASPLVPSRRGERPLPRADGRGGQGSRG